MSNFVSALPRLIPAFYNNYFIIPFTPWSTAFIVFTEIFLHNIQINCNF